MIYEYVLLIGITHTVVVARECFDVEVALNRMARDILHRSINDQWRLFFC